MLVIIIINLGNTVVLEAGIWRKEFITRKETENHGQIICLWIHHPSTLYIYQCYLIKTHISDDQLSNNIEACEHASGAPQWPVNLLMSSASMTKWRRRSEVNRKVWGKKEIHLQVNEEVQLNRVSKKAEREKIKPNGTDSCWLSEDGWKWQAEETRAEMPTGRMLKWKYSGEDVEGEKDRNMQALSGKAYRLVILDLNTASCVCFSGGQS